MSYPIVALLVHHKDEPMASLQKVLQSQSIVTSRAANCKEAAQFLAKAAPHIVFSDTELLDGSWSDVVRLTAKMRTTKVIVVSPLADIRLYLETIDRGAFDFLAPPFRAIELAHVIRCAVTRGAP